MSREPFAELVIKSDAFGPKISTPLLAEFTFGLYKFMRKYYTEYYSKIELNIVDLNERPASKVVDLDTPNCSSFQ